MSPTTRTSAKQLRMETQSFQLAKRRSQIPNLMLSTITMKRNIILTQNQLDHLKNIITPTLTRKQRQVMEHHQNFINILKEYIEVLAKSQFTSLWRRILTMKMHIHRRIEMCQLTSRTVTLASRIGRIKCKVQKPTGSPYPWNKMKPDLWSFEN